MPHLAFELDALENVPATASAAGMGEGDLAYGLLKLWRFCWRTKTDRVDRPHLTGFFPAEDGTRVVGALVAFNFLEAADSGFRVKGAQRYLRVNGGQSRGGHAAKGNLKQYREPVRLNTGCRSGSTGSPPADSRQPAGSPPAEPPARDRAYSEQRSANSVSSSEEEGPRPQIGATITPPTTSPDEWTGEDFWRWAQALRREGKLIPEKMPNHRRLSAWWSECLMTEGVTPEAMKEGFHAFGESKHWENATPPYPFAAFMSEWTKYTKPEVAYGATA